MIEGLKTCSRCDQPKPATPEFFERHGQKKDGLAPHCKVCIAEHRKAVRGSATGRRKGVLRYTLAERKKRYRTRHPDRIRAEHERRKLRDPGYGVRYIRRKLEEDPLFRMITRLRARTRKAFLRLGRQRPDTTKALLGCTGEELRARFEGLFQPGMSWENMAEWEIDHVRPIASFDLTDAEQVRRAFHHTNLQPLWRADNRRKGAKWS